MTETLGQLTWISHPDDLSSHGQKHLYMRYRSTDKWVYYEESEYSIPDKENKTPGFPTFCVLRDKGWKLIDGSQVKFWEIKPRDLEKTKKITT